MPPIPDGSKTGACQRGPIAGLLLGLVLSGSACVGIPEPSRQLKTEDVTLAYHDPQTDREISSLKLEHPLTISEEGVETQLHSLFYENLNLIAKPRPVFHRDQVQRLKRLLTKALNHARPDRYISFEVTGEDGKNAGDVFASGGRLHWRLTQIDGEKFHTKNWARLEQKWRLVPRQGQRFFVKKILMEQDIQNWIVANLNLPTPPALDTQRTQRKSQTAPPQAQEAPPAQAPAPTAREQELERKLYILQNLKDKQLIDEEEYNSRRQKLLDAYL